MPGLSEFAKEKQQGYRVVKIQVATALMITMIAYLYSHSWSIASATLWGALTAAINGISLVRGLSKIEINQNYQPHSILRGVIRNSMERFFLVILSLSLAMGGLKLSAAAVLCGFVVGQVVPMVARILMIKR
jgi:type IV secretory pathway VirB6-like protein